MPDPTLSRDSLYTQQINHRNTKFVAADTTTAKVIFTAGTRGSIVTSFTLSTDETTLSGFNLYEVDKGTSYQKERFVLPGSTPYGTDGTNGELNVLASLEGVRVDSNGNYAYYLSPGKSLSMAMTTAVAANKTVTVKIQGEDF
jgi:hypothetical protein